jgi:N utilization substance protein A
MDKQGGKTMNTELLEALNILEKEKDISKETLLDAIENSLMNACKNHFGKTDNIKLIMNKEHVSISYMLRKQLWKK